MRIRADVYLVLHQLFVRKIIGTYIGLRNSNNTFQLASLDEVLNCYSNSKVALVINLCYLFYCMCIEYAYLSYTLKRIPSLSQHATWNFGDMLLAYPSLSWRATWKPADMLLVEAAQHFHMLEKKRTWEECRT